MEVRIFEDNHPPLTEERLVEFESKIGHRLPADYRSFLLQHNGGKPDRKLFAIEGCGAEALVDIFFGIDREHGNLEDWLKELAGDMADKYLPIGFDPGANALLLDLASGEIYYWDSARFFPMSSDEENSYRVGASFFDFLDSLQPDA